jgi:thymidine kinase
MFSGKSLNLIRKTRELGGSFECFKPTIDTRSGNFIFSRDAIGRLPARSIDDVREAIDSSADVVVFDEVQFFKSEGFEDTINFLRDRNKIILMGGLDRIANGLHWDIYPIIMKLADEVINLTARCNICGEEATYTKRVGDNDAIVQIEGEEGAATFFPVCERCFRIDINPSES